MTRTSRAENDAAHGSPWAATPDRHGRPYFLNMAWVRSPRDRMYAIRSRISSSLNVSSSPAGIIDSFDAAEQMVGHPIALSDAPPRIEADGERIAV